MIDYDKFCLFWSRFTCNVKEIEHIVKCIVNLIRKNKPFGNEIKTDIPKVKHKIIKEKLEKQWKVKCIACNKGFNNKNTLKDHLNSVNHKSKSLGCDDIQYFVPENEL